MEKINSRWDIMDKKYTIITYGCQMNVHESEKMAGILVRMGYKETKNQEEADLILFNTCCIRENAENHAFGNIGNLKKLKKKNPDLIIAVGGCMPQEKGKPELLKQKFPFIDIIFGNLNLNDLENLILQKQRQKKSVVDVHEKEVAIVENEEPFRTSYPNAWVNIMYGCNNFCTYCIVPYVRGRERSRTPEAILAECETLVKEGYKEITLLGQNVNSYGNDGVTDVKFPELLSKVAAIPGEFRVRFMTSHPKDFTEDLVRVIAANDKICHLVHLPVQSGSDKILQKMNRRYTSGEYREKIKMLKSVIPDCEITSDLIVGFPGETEEDFLETVALAKDVDFVSAFTFVYSKRTGTKAATMPDQIPEAVQKDRIMRLVDTINELTRKKSETYIGKTVKILVEDFYEKRGMYLGRDEYGRMAYFKSENNIIGEFVRVAIRQANGISLMGDLIE